MVCTQVTAVGSLALLLNSDPSITRSDPQEQSQKLAQNPARPGPRANNIEHLLYSDEPQTKTEKTRKSTRESRGARRTALFLLQLVQEEFLVEEEFGGGKRGSKESIPIRKEMA